MMSTSSKKFLATLVIIISFFTVFLLCFQFLLFGYLNHPQTEAENFGYLNFLLPFFLSLGFIVYFSREFVLIGFSKYPNRSNWIKINVLFILAIISIRWQFTHLNWAIKSIYDDGIFAFERLSIIIAFVFTIGSIVIEIMKFRK